MTPPLDVTDGAEHPAHKAPWATPSRVDLGSLLDAANNRGSSSDIRTSDVLS